MRASKYRNEMPLTSVLLRFALGLSFSPGAILYARLRLRWREDCPWSRTAMERRRLGEILLAMMLHVKSYLFSCSKIEGAQEVETNVEARRNAD